MLKYILRDTYLSNYEKIYSKPNRERCRMKLLPTRNFVRFWNALELLAFEHPLQPYGNWTGSMDESLFDHPGLDDRDFLAYMLELMPQGVRGKWLKGLANHFVGRWEKRGSAEDIDRAIELLEQALVTFPVISGDYAWCLEGLDDALRKRFGTTGSLDDLQRVLELNEKALDSTPISHSNYHLYLNNVSTVLLSRFEATDSMDDLNRVITMAQRAVATAPQNDDPGNVKHIVSSSTAELEMLKSVTTIDQVFESLSRATVEPQPDRPNYLIQLSLALQRRFEKTRSIDDLNQATIATEEAVACTMPDHPKRALYINYLCQTLRNRFEIKRGIDDLNQAIAIWEQAVIPTHVI
jgi:tetratricopeptide (TPR) repeat protein